MHTRRYTPADQPAAEALIAACYREPPRLPFLLDAQVVLAAVGPDIVGLAGFGRSALHPTIAAEYICVHPEHRRKGIATRLHQQLLSAFPPVPTDTALDISCFADQEAERAFIRHLGFSRYLDCALCVVSLGDVPSLRGEATIRSLEAHARCGGAPSARSFFIQRYQEEHQEYLPVSTAPGIWDAYYDDGDLSLGAVMIEDGKIVGCSLVYRDELPASVGGYATGHTPAEEAHRLKLLYAHQFRRLQQQGAQRAYIEVDSTERIAQHILDWLPAQERTVFLRHRLQLGCKK